LSDHHNAFRLPAVSGPNVHAGVQQLDFRSLIVFVTVVLSLAFVVYLALKSGGRFARELRSELEQSKARKHNFATRRRVLELVGKFSKDELEQIVFECWRRDFLRSHESSARLRLGIPDDRQLQQIHKEILGQHEETLNKTRMELKEMSEDKVLELVDLYVKEWTARAIDPYQRILEVITAAGLKVNS
jgi:hypothetical protein